jgi:hypothetical protein
VVVSVVDAHCAGGSGQQRLNDERANARHSVDVAWPRCQQGVGVGSCLPDEIMKDDCWEGKGSCVEQLLDSVQAMLEGLFGSDRGRIADPDNDASRDASAGYVAAANPVAAIDVS